MGKWARKAPSWSIPASREDQRTKVGHATQKEYSAIDSQLAHISREKAAMEGVSFARPNFNSSTGPRVNSEPASQSPGSSVRPTPEKIAQSNTPPPQSAPPPPPNPYAQVVKSRRSAADIENDLFAGINADAPDLKPSKNFLPPAPTSPSMDSLLNAFGTSSVRVNATSQATENSPYTKASQPFRVSEKSVRDVMEAAKKSEERKESKTLGSRPDPRIPQFGFMTTRVRPSIFPPQIDTSAPKPTPSFEPEPPEDVKRVSSAEWHSSSREQWTYEIDTKTKDTEAAEAQSLVNEIPIEQTMTPEQTKARKRAEVATLRRKAKAKKFIVDMHDLGVWEEEKVKVETLPDIKVEKNLFIPSSVSVANFADLLKIPLETLQKKMELLGLEPEQCSYDYGTYSQG